MIVVLMCSTPRARFTKDIHPLLAVPAIVKVFFPSFAYGAYHVLLQLNTYISQVRRMGFKRDSIFGLHALGVSGSSG